jgi:hypothetical protein
MDWERRPECLRESKKKKLTGSSGPSQTCPICFLQKKVRVSSGQGWSGHRATPLTAASRARRTAASWSGVKRREHGREATDPPSAPKKTQTSDAAPANAEASSVKTLENTRREGARGTCDNVAAYSLFSLGDDLLTWPSRFPASMASRNSSRALTFSGSFALPSCNNSRPRSTRAAAASADIAAAIDDDLVENRKKQKTTKKKPKSSV